MSVAAGLCLLQVLSQAPSRLYFYSRCLSLAVENEAGDYGLIDHPVSPHAMAWGLAGGWQLRTVNTRSETAICIPPSVRTPRTATRMRTRKLLIHEECETETVLSTLDLFVLFARGPHVTTTLANYIPRETA